MNLTYNAGLFFGQKEIERAKTLIYKEDWAKAILKQFTEEVANFDSRTWEWWNGIIPGKYSIYAHGYRGCPVCRGRWDWFGENVCSFDRPVSILCPHCNRLFKLDDPTDEYYDAGEGIEAHKRRFYLRGVWNAYVVRYVDHIMEISAILWALTENKIHAERAVFIADHLASICPTTKASAEMPVSDGRFLYLSSIVNRRKVAWSLIYELLSKTPEFNCVSAIETGINIKENFKENLLYDYLFEHCPPEGEEWHNFHNHDTDTLRAMLAIGIVTDNQEYVNFAASYSNLHTCSFENILPYWLR